MVPVEHKAETDLTSPLGQVHGVGSLGYGHPHKSHAFQDIKCHVNKAPPLLSECVVTCQKVIFTWCGDKPPHLPGAFQVLQSDPGQQGSCNI